MELVLRDTNQNQEKTNNRAVLVSLGIHALFAAFAIWLGTLPPTPIQPDKNLTWIEIEPTPSTETQKDQTRKEVVQTLPGQEVKDAAKDAFLGERTQIVDRQTVSKNKTTVIGQNTQGAQSQEKSETKSARPMAKAQPMEATPLTSLGVPMLPFQKKNLDTAQEMQKQETQPRWAQQGEQLQEYVKGFNEGDQTLLNTKEYVFYGYFSRIREKLDRAWVPILRERVSMWYRGGRRIASEMEHVTRVLVVLNDQGEITEVKMISESGTRILDEAAVRAFNEAGPFPNPPSGLINEKRQIEVPWEFVLRT